MSIERYHWCHAGMGADEQGYYVLYPDHVAMLADLRRHNERMQQVLKVLIDHGVTSLYSESLSIDFDLQDILENV